MQSNICPDCKQEKSLEQFAKPNGWYCKDCLNRRSREWRHKKRAEFLAARGPLPERTHKICQMCNQEKPLDEFNFANKAKGHRASYCKPCSYQRFQRDRQRRGRIDEQLRYKCNKVGVKVEWFLERMEKQHGLCAICGGEETQVVQRGVNNKVRSLAIDHDHISGKPRGLLCFRCNTAVHMLDKYGYIWAENAVRYLKENETGETC